MEIRILAEGSTKWQRLIKHWGLSILIDDDILFDTFGKPGYVVRQLKRAMVVAGNIRHIVISHDDWDHISGLWKILDRSRNATVHICPNFSPDSKSRVRWLSAHSVEVDKPTEIRNNVFLSGEIKGGFRGGIALPEQYLAIKTLKGMVVITGCAHPGIIEIVQHAKSSFCSEVHLLIGGFHMKDNSDKVNRDIVSKLKKLGVRQVIPLHCTGKRAQNMFRKAYGKDCIVSGEGQAIEI